MSIIEKLSSSQGKRSKELNKALAKEISAENNREAINELIQLLDNSDRNIQSDAIEVLYETGYLAPEMIADHSNCFVDLLENKNNRLIWGAMIALSSISRCAPEIVFTEFSKITDAVERGSVITKDAGVMTYANLATIESQSEEVFPFLFKELEQCPAKQLPQYAEKALIAIDKNKKVEFTELINSRIASLEKESQIRRIKKVLRLVEKI